ncbi:MAG: TolC family protein [Comamonadaceae bacterium]|nr:TolC family protein [Comamonadaceae bacterium]
MLATLAALWGTPTWSQPAPGVPALLAADPATAVPAPPVLTLPTPGGAQPMDAPADLQQAREIWRKANERVAEFPRGHIDLLRWEANNPDQVRPAPLPESASDVRLGMGEALRLSLRHRPDLFTRTGMNALERAEVQVAFARHRRDLERAWIDAVAARQAARHAAEVLDAARVGSELGLRMVRAGNWSHAKLMREQLTEATAWQNAANAQIASMQTRERLAGLMGLWDAATVAQLDQRLPDSLPALPASALPGPDLAEADIESAVLRSHPTLGVELQAAQRSFTGLSAGRWDAWVKGSEAALQSMPAGAAEGLATPPHLDDITLLRDHPLERAVQAQAELLAKAAQRRSMARESWAQVRLRHASAQHAQDVVSKLQTALEQETLLRYNGMLQSSWELLASARERIGSLDSALQARRDFWRAHSDWQALLAGADYQGPDAPAAAGGTAGAAAPH